MYWGKEFMKEASAKEDAKKESLRKPPQQEIKERLEDAISNTSFNRTSISLPSCNYGAGEVLSSISDSLRAGENINMLLMLTSLNIKDLYLDTFIKETNKVLQPYGLVLVRCYHSHNDYQLDLLSSITPKQ